MNQFYEPETLNILEVVLILPDFSAYLRILQFDISNITNCRMLRK